MDEFPHIPWLKRLLSALPPIHLIQLLLERLRLEQLEVIQWSWIVASYMDMTHMLAIPALDSTSFERVGD